MITFSKVLTALPIFVGFAMLGVDYFFGFDISQEQVNLIEFIIGSTVIGGVGNAGFKRYTEYKNKTQV